MPSPTLRVGFSHFLAHQTGSLVLRVFVELFQTFPYPGVHVTCFGKQQDATDGGNSLHLNEPCAGEATLTHAGVERSAQLL